MTAMHDDALDILTCPFCNRQPVHFMGGLAGWRKPWVTCHGDKGKDHPAVSMPLASWNARATPALAIRAARDAAP